MRTATRVTLFLTLAAALGFVLSGTFHTEAEAKAKKGGGKAAPSGAADCKKDEDCVLVQDDCCSCNQGGKARAIPKKQRDAYEKDLKKRCKGTTECIEMMSQDPSCSQRPFCGAGICELGDAPSDSAP